MEKQTQRAAVFAAVMAVFAANKINFKEGSDASEQITPEMRKEVCAHVSQSFIDGKTTLNKEYDEKQIRDYSPGLVSNWLRKDTNLNGGIKYETKNPGSRAGQGSPKVKELRKLLARFKGTENEAKVQVALDGEIAKHKASKTKTVEIDASLIPEELQGLLG